MSTFSGAWETARRRLAPSPPSRAAQRPARAGPVRPPGSDPDPRLQRWGLQRDHRLDRPELLRSGPGGILAVDDHSAEIRPGPVSEGILTYSQASDPASPWYGNMTRLYSRQQWVKLPYKLAYTNRPSGIQQVLSFYGHAPQDRGR